MKKCYSLLLALTLPAFALAQQKNEMGFVAKAGIYAPSYQKMEFTDNVEGSYHSAQQGPGATYTLGFWYARRLGGFVKLSGELLYRRASVASEDKQYYEYYDGGIKQQSTFTQNQRVTENTLSLPIKIHLSLKENGKTTLALGAGLSRVFSAEMEGKYEYNFNFFPNASNVFTGMKSNWDQFELEKNLTAGLFHRLDAKTTLGLEYSFEQSSKRQYVTNLPTLALIDCFCYGYSPIPLRNMNSFSISLLHNIR